MKSRRPKRTSSATGAPRHTKVRSAFPWPQFLTILALTTLVFAQVVRHDFTNWDDPQNVAGNPLVVSPSMTGLAHVWAQPVNSMYSPLVFTSFMVDTILGRGAPSAYHFTNLLLHLGATAALFLLICALPGVRRPWLAAAATLLFAVHPLQAESVAWITGRKDVLAGFLAILAMLLHARATASNTANPRHYQVAALIAFTLGLFAKATIIALPVALLALDVWVRALPLRAAALRMLPWFAIALLLGGIATAAQPMPDWLSQAVPVWKRPLLAGHALMFYISKSLVPIGLAPVYTINAPKAAAATSSIVALLLSLGLVAYALYRRGRIGVVGAMFLVPLLPVLGLVPFLYQQISLTADRYAYLPLVAMAIGAAWIMEWAYDRLSPARHGLISGFIVLVIVLLSVLTFRQAATWRDSISLWTHATRASPGVPEAHTNLAYALHHTEHLDEAERQLELAVKADPDFLMAWNLLGILQLESKGPEAALPALREAVRATRDRGYRDQRLSNALNNLGVALMRSQDHASAEQAFREAAAITSSPEVLKNLADSVKAQNRTTETQVVGPEPNETNPLSPTVNE